LFDPVPCFEAALRRPCPLLLGRCRPSAAVVIGRAPLLLPPCGAAQGLPPSFSLPTDQKSAAQGLPPSFSLPTDQQECSTPSPSPPSTSRLHRLTGAPPTPPDLAATPPSLLPFGELHLSPGFPPHHTPSQLLGATGSDRHRRPPPELTNVGGNIAVATAPSSLSAVSIAFTTHTLLLAQCCRSPARVTADYHVPHRH
jgi:hypothetical protein